MKLYQLCLTVLQLVLNSFEVYSAIAKYFWVLPVGRIPSFIHIPQAKVITSHVGLKLILAKIVLALTVL